MIGDICPHLHLTRDVNDDQWKCPACDGSCPGRDVWDRVNVAGYIGTYRLGMQLTVARGLIG